MAEPLKLRGSSFGVEVDGAGEGTGFYPRSKWWYGRVAIGERRLLKNLGVKIGGEVPAKLTQFGDPVFERTRAKAQAALEKLQLDLKKRSTAEELVQTIHEIRTGGRVQSIPLADAGPVGRRYRAAGPLVLVMSRKLRAG